MVEIGGAPKWPIQCLIPLTKPSQLIPNMSRNSRQFAKSNLAIHLSDKHPESLMEWWEHEWCCPVPPSQVLTIRDCPGAPPFTVPHPGYTWSCHRLWTSVTSLQKASSKVIPKWASFPTTHTRGFGFLRSIFLLQLSSTPVTRIHLLLSSKPLPTSRPIPKAYSYSLRSHSHSKATSGSGPCSHVSGRCHSTPIVRLHTATHFCCRDHSISVL